MDDVKLRMKRHRARLRANGKQQIALHVAKDLVAACDRFAQTENRSRSLIVEEALADYLGRRGGSCASVGGIELAEIDVLDCERYAADRDQSLGGFLGDAVREWLACAEIRKRLERQERSNDDTERLIPMAFGPPVRLPKPRRVRRASPALIETADPRTLSHQLKIEIRKIRPLIWRRVRVPSTIRLTELHDVIQVLFGWEGYHLYEFGSRYDDKIDDTNIKLYRLCPKEGWALNYTYDIGDYWQLEIVVEGVVAAEGDGQASCECLAGKNAGPPEDCGGPLEYPRILRALKKRRGDDYRRARQVVGRCFKPDFFELATINDDLMSLSEEE